MLPIHPQSLKVLCQNVKEEMHLQENIFLTGNVFQYPLYHVTYAPVKLEVNTSNG